MAVKFTAWPAYGAGGESAVAETSDHDVMEDERHGGRDIVAMVRALCKLRHYREGILAQFFYVGAQVGTWSYLIQYAQFNVPDLSEKTGADLLNASLVMLTIGRAVSTVLLRYASGARVMLVFGLINVVLCAVAVLGGGWLGTCSVVATSFFMSLMFPTIFTMAIAGLDKDQTQLGSSVIVRPPRARLGQLTLPHARNAA